MINLIVILSIILYKCNKFEAKWINMSKSINRGEAE